MDEPQHNTFEKYTDYSVWQNMYAVDFLSASAGLYDCALDRRIWNGRSANHLCYPDCTGHHAADGSSCLSLSD